MRFRSLTLEEGSKMPTLDELSKLATKRYGDGRVLLGLAPLREMRSNVFDFPRLMLGVFPLDYAIGGGIPMNVPIQFFGPPDSGKSTTAYLAARALSRTCLNPGCMKPIHLCRCESPSIKKTFIAQFEGNVIDETWFKVLGYDADEHLVLALPDYAEQGCSLIEAAIQSEDCGLVVVDSVGAMLPRAELESSYEDSSVGSQARLLTKFIKRISNILVSELRKGHFVSVILINQVRAVIGGSFFGPTESTAGGHALRHGVRLSIRFSQLSVPTGEEKPKDEPNYVLRFSASMLSGPTKRQMFIMAPKAEFRLVVGDYRGCRSGVVYDFPTVWEKAKELGAFSGGDGKTIVFSDDLQFQRVRDIEEVFRCGSEDHANAIRYLVLQKAREAAFEDIKSRGSRVINEGSLIEKGVIASDETE